MQNVAAEWKMAAEPKREVIRGLSPDVRLSAEEGQADG